MADPSASQGPELDGSLSAPRRLVVLVVEDEPLVRFDAIESFQDAGFEVVDAHDADQALLALDRRPDICALFSDVHMPGLMTGVQLARLARRRRPGLAVVLTSGVLQVEACDLPDGGRFLPKPYDATQVASLIRELVGDPGF